MVEKLYKFPEVLFFQEGPGVRNHQYTTSGVKLLNVSNLRNGQIDLTTSDRYISENEAFNKYSHFLCDPNDFIIASSGIKIDSFNSKMGFIHQSDLPVCMNTSTIRFKVLNKEVLEIRYFMYYLKSIAFKKVLTKVVTGSAQLNFGPSHLKNMSISLPNLDVQKNIVQRLDRVNKLIEIKRKLLFLLDGLVKSRFVELISKNKLIYQKVRLKDCCLISSGATPSRKNSDYWDENGINWFKTTELKNNFLIDSEEKISELGYEKTSVKLLPKHTVLIAMYGQGKTRGMTGYLLNNATTNQACAALISLDIINPKYLWYTMINSYDRLRNMAKGGTQPNLSVSSIKDFEIILPPIDIQNKFTNYIEQINKLKFAQIVYN